MQIRSTERTLIYSSRLQVTLRQRCCKEQQMQKRQEYHLVTEAPGLKASSEQVERIYQRYRFARQYGVDKDVLEVACGTGMGLGYLAQSAHRVVAGDIDDKNIALARRYSATAKDKVQIDALDAHHLSYPDESFDLVLLYEAIYYLREPELFVGEARRVLRTGGTLIICTVNRDWEDFHPSPYTWKYFSVPQLTGLLGQHFHQVLVYGGFQIGEGGLKSSAISMIKHFALRYHLIPGSLKARAYLKRLFMGKLSGLPDMVHDGMAPYHEPERIPSDQANKGFKILYFVAQK